MSSARGSVRKVHSRLDKRTQTINHAKSLKASDYLIDALRGSCRYLAEQVLASELQ